ncbi:MAG: toll/interleukin-1 receptor domain-containing protein [Planctomycetaceae bacterium]|jgi:hypothetical protein|nr:toll/interleukin-1 receptor domain-containing protein [Planctomycetaceae bacterium]MBT6154008.1 toll/interleukin-1 receptor domain-containing protein [Planctomycetaceae bacterium]MBT6483213.1 toll/interleukin-1 receptor domain-containing protein [Planctomycetaceae bacterium]MBT6496243.1 toll/interleukin-1 receptor domain-containing protein [Planctomycetaceae bacterium]
MASVFISHSSNDRQFVGNDLVPLLRSHGIETWYSTDDIHSAEDWEKKIREGLRDCDWFLVVLSPNGVVSDWVQAEVHWATDNRKGRIIPILLAPCRPEDLHIKLIRIQYIDFHANREQAVGDLLTVLGHAPIDDPIDDEVQPTDEEPTDVFESSSPPDMPFDDEPADGPMDSSGYSPLTDELFDDDPAI